LRRNWIKIYPEGFLRRTLFKELLPIERWVWVGFLCLAGDNALDGKICLTEDMGYTDEQLAKLLDTDINILKVSKKKMIKFEKISVDKNNVIQILSWNIYQSEYQRQRDYRKEYKKKLQREVTTESYNAELPIDRDRDRDREKDIDKKKNKNKEKKYKYADFVSMTKKEYQKLIKEYGEKYTKKFIDKLNAFKGSKGKTYKSDYLAILNWVTEAVLKDKDKEAIQEAKIKERQWATQKDDYEWKPIPPKVKEQTHKVLNIPDRDKLNKLKEDKRNV